MYILRRHAVNSTKLTKSWTDNWCTLHGFMSQ